MYVCMYDPLFTDFTHSSTVDLFYCSHSHTHTHTHKLTHTHKCGQ